MVVALAVEIGIAAVMAMMVPSWPVEHIGYVVGATVLALAFTTLSFRIAEHSAVNFHGAMGMTLVLAGRPTTALACVVACSLLTGARRPLVRHLLIANIAADVAQVGILQFVFGNIMGSPEPLSAAWIVMLMGALLISWAHDWIIVAVPSALGGYGTWKELALQHVQWLRSIVTASLPLVALGGIVLHESSPWFLAVMLFPFLVPYEIFSRSEAAVDAKLHERQMRDRFARFVPEAVVDQLVDGGLEIELGGEQREISVLFCDIRGFTAWSEELAPQVVVTQLNRLLSVLTACVFETGGTLDKFTGDGLMAFWGAPLDQPNHADRATETAAAMEAALAAFNAELGGDYEFRIGIGVHSGPAVVGNIGHEQRHDYTAIGDTVNLSARLEAATKDLGVGTLVSEATHGELSPLLQARFVAVDGEISVKGRRQPVQVYSLAAVEPHPARVESGLAA